MADNKSGDSAAQPPEDGDPADHKRPRAVEPHQPSAVDKPTDDAKPGESWWASWSLVRWFRGRWSRFLQCWARWSLARRAAIVALGGLVVAFLVVRPFMAGWVPIHWPDARLRAVGLLLAAVIAMPAAYVALRRQVELEKSNARDQDRLDFERERESKRQEERSEDQRREVRRDLGERFVTATTLLGDEKAAVRLAGVTALAGVADDWGELKDQEQQQACIDILCDYLRQPFPMIVEQASGTAYEDLIPSPEEVQVRAAITRTIAKHLRGPREHGDEEAKAGRWSALNFDFSSVNFAWPLDMSEVIFNGGANWSAAKFSGAATWIGATFSGAATWIGATFNSTANWDEATFNGDAYWLEATFNSTANWLEATFNGDANWDEATFNGDAHWSEATFHRTALWVEATFHSTALWVEATFHSTAHWNNATFNGNAYWLKATFNNDASWNNAMFTSDADWHEATFNAYTAWGNATFNANANWDEATFARNANWRSANFTKKPSFRYRQAEKAASFGSLPSFSGSSPADEKEFLAEIDSIVKPPEDSSADDGVAADDPKPDE